MNKVLTMVNKFLFKVMDGNGSSSSSTTDGSIDWKTWSGGKFEFVGKILDVVKPVLYALMAVIGAAGAIYAVVLGVRLAKAEDASKREEEKKHLITVLIAVAVTVALMLFFTVMLDKILVAFLKPSDNEWTDD